MSRQRLVVVAAVVGFVTTVGGAVLWGTAWGLFGYVPLAVTAALWPDRPRPRHAVGVPPPKRREFLDMGSMTWEEEWKWRHHFEVPPTGDEVGWEAGVGADDQGGGWDGGVDWPPPSGEPYGGLPPPPPEFPTVSPAGFFRGLDEVFGSITSTSLPPADPDADDYSYDPKLDEPFSLIEVVHEDDDPDWARRLRDEVDNMPGLGTELPGAGESGGEDSLEEEPVAGRSPTPAPGTWPAHEQRLCGPGCFWCDVDNERRVHTFDMPAITEQTISDWGARLAQQIESWHTEPWATQ